MRIRVFYAVSLMLLGVLNSCQSNSNWSRVFDDEGDLTLSQKDSLEALFLSHEQESGAQIAVVTRSHMDTFLNPFAYAAYLGDSLGIGAEKQNGILVFYCDTKNNAGIAVGNALNNSLPDSVIKTILYGVMVPEFRNDRGFNGLYFGAEEMIRLLESGK